MGRPGVRGLRIWAVTTVLLAVLGPPAGLLWAAIAPPVRYLMLDGHLVLADPETQALIAGDGRYALVTGAAGVLCGVLAYLAGGRDNDVPLLLGLGTGGTAAALLAWWTGHRVGQGGFEEAVRAAAGRAVESPADLHAVGVVVSWPLLAVAVYGVLEAVLARLAPRDRGQDGAGEPDEVGGGQLDLQAAPPRGDQDRVEP
ncbi:hypothetical protein SAMN04489712_101304 [Thermomonospora echinospora]|uniref:ABC transporter permease n=1 Tax=Thermomonospora echinospora TaxID=1992 RepID=A0A1H5SPP6_9ACTN|nr:hypothetical protein [Thermomonospora echinospora]SEF52400.1 hypothetical protein SAMN04489712_101304 [Thermomonospora echinospora]